MTQPWPTLDAAQRHSYKPQVGDKALLGRVRCGTHSQRCSCVHCPSLFTNAPINYGIYSSLLLSVIAGELRPLFER